MDPVATNTIPIMAVCLSRLDDPNSRLRLLVNLDYFERSPQFRAGVLLHEINHVLLGHLTEPKFRRVAYPRVLELAMELSADEGIPEPLPVNGLELSEFKKFGVRPGQSTLERYRLLVNALEEGRFKIQDWWFSRMRDTHRPQQEGGARGPGLGDILDAHSDGASERNWGRRERGLGGRSSELELRRMKEAIATHLSGERGGADDPSLAGTPRRMAKELERVVLRTGEGNQLNWPRVLREAFPRRRSVLPDYSRPNRRFLTRVGEIPGRRRRPPKPTLLVGVDTSGSMDGAALDRIASEIQSLARSARLTIAECDSVVHRIYPVGPRPRTFVGGGDTDFSPVFEEAQAAHFEGLVYFTDGKGSLPAPLALPTLWVLTHSDPFQASWGSVVRIPG
tara:strand:- start:211 stop:1392 length:1182 start_codon:yes stop_codon:yes gene_type:complete